MKLHKLHLVGLVILSAGSAAMAGAQAVPTAANAYEIVDSSTGKCVYVDGNYAEEDTCANTASTQRWLINAPGSGAGVAAETGYYVISEPSAGTSNNIWSDNDEAGTVTNGSDIWDNYDTTAKASTSFQFTAETAPYYEIVIDGGYCVAGSSSSYLTLATCTAASNQLWEFIPVYTVTHSSPSLSIPQAGTGTNTITLTDTTGFSGNVVLTTSTLPTGVTVAYSCSSNTITTSGGTCMLTFTTTSSATIGTTTVTITGTASSPTITETTTIALTVSPEEYVFVPNSGGTVTSLTEAGTAATNEKPGGGTGAAIDSAGDFWSISGGSSLSEFSNLGVLSNTYSSTGISGATALAIDGKGVVWVANSGSVSAVPNAGATSAVPQVAQAGSINAPASITVDTAGSLWIANSGNGSVTEVIGIAAPVTAPVVTQVVNGTPGTKP